jgi:serine protease Do
MHAVSNLITTVCLMVICLTCFLQVELSSAIAQDDSALQTMQAMEQLMVNSIERCEKSVVAIARVRKGSIGDPTDPNFVPNEFGTGVVIDKAGLILTNYHVLGEIEKNDYYVWVQHRPFFVTRIMKSTVVQAADPWTDLAVLEIEADDLEPIQFGDAKKLRKGQIVISLGNPYAIARDGEPSASWGIISNLNRKASAITSSLQTDKRSETIHEFGTLIQTDAKLNLGTSGGALINLQGEMIGLTSSLAALRQYESAAGFAIPVDDVFKRVVDALKKGEQPEFGFLGVAPSNLSEAARRNGSLGVRIERVVDGSPAAYTDLKIGDLITHVNDAPIHDTDELMRELSSQFVGASIQLSIVRTSSKPLKVAVQLGKKRIDSNRPSFAKNAPTAWRGMLVDYPTAIKDFYEFGYRVDPKGCVVVVEVELDSPAWQAGVRPQMFINRIDGHPITNPRAFYAQVKDKDKPVQLGLTSGSATENKIIVSPEIDEKANKAKTNKAAANDTGASN